MKKGQFFLFIVVSITLLLLPTGCKKSESNPDNDIAGIQWILESIRYSDQNVVQIEELFTILFNNDGSLQMEVDCNTCAGTYQLGAGNSITFTDHIACTEVFCGVNSKDTEFHDALDTASRYEKDGTILTIFFNSEQSRLIFHAR